MQSNMKEALEHLKTIGDWIRFSTSQFYAEKLFFGHGTDNAWDEAVQLVLFALHLPPNSDAKIFATHVTPTEKNAIAELLQARITSRKPLPYLTNQAWFMGLSFYVDERVLIPRSPLGEWIEKGFQPFLTEPPLTILDMCTGSGCLAVAAAQVFPEASIDAVDISPDALAVAEKNVADYGLEERVQLIQSDLFNNLPKQSYDLILCNPPYVSETEMRTLPREFQHEPTLALFAEEEGVAMVRQILNEASDYLSPEGILVLDVGNTESAAIKAFPEISFTVLELSRGGSGILLVTARDLANFS